MIKERRWYRFQPIGESVALTLKGVSLLQSATDAKNPIVSSEPTGDNGRVWRFSAEKLDTVLHLFGSYVSSIIIGYMVAYCELLVVASTTVRKEP